MKTEAVKTEAVIDITSEDEGAFRPSPKKPKTKPKKTALPKLVAPTGVIIIDDHEDAMEGRHVRLAKQPR